jgi:YbgC/YbaW family acyl-CoA thioester hydrolase
MKSEGDPNFEVRERVRWSDVDSAGIIYFGAYARFSDIAESEFYRTLGYTYATFRELGFFMPRVHVEFDFFKPALLDDELNLRVRVGGVGVHSVRLHIDFFREHDSALLAEATLIASCTDRDGKSTVLPDSFASTVRAFVSAVA